MPTFPPHGHHPWLNWHALTWFGDTALLLPAAAALGLAFLIAPGVRGLALRWAVAFGTVGFLVLGSKIAFMAWGWGSAAYDFTGFSGHSALAATFWPVVGWVAARNHGHLLCRLAIAAGAAFAVAIAISRLAIGVHSTSEVVTGVALGLTASACFILRSRQGVGALRTMVSVAAIFVLGIVAMRHGQPAPTTRWMEITVVRLLGVQHPYTREDLRRGRA